jgi:hypothetical protein
MKIMIFDKAVDKVINSVVATGKTNYGFALDHLYPLTNRFSAQRKIQDKKFYKRLERDILNGCLMPPLTIAFVDKDLDFGSNNRSIESYINDHIDTGYILDGIQRLNTIKRVSDDSKFDRELPIYLNVIIATTADKLLYRMITLNNGQRPMTPRHQIEILTQELFDFNGIEIDVQTEKERSENIIRGSFNLGDISKAYLAFLTNSVNNENNKIIDDKMDQIIVGRILDTEPDDSHVEFKNILVLISRLSENSKAKTWLKISNNLIGFSVGVRQSYDQIMDVSVDEFADSTGLFDEAFKAINTSKVNLGKFRRQLSKEFIENYRDYSEMDELELIEVFMESTS